MDKCLLSKQNIVSVQDDFLGSNFKAFTLNAAEQQLCTLVNYQTSPQTQSDKTAILYVHGYTDYFFQTEQAVFFEQLGFNFYAVDLHGYGRSIRPFQADHNKNHFSDYFYDLDACLKTMSNQGVQNCIILGHSTGGLIVSRYLSSHYQATNLGVEIIGLILNSPFLSLPMPLREEKWRLPLYKIISKTFSRVTFASKKNTLYAQSIHSSLNGEWAYRLDWKPSQGSPLSFQWLKEIMQEQEVCLQSRCNIPTLLCRSSHSTYQQQNLTDILQGDAVLDVENMEAKAKHIYTHLDIAIIDNGFHDLLLSPLATRLAYLNKVQHWLSINYLNH